MKNFQDLICSVSFEYVCFTYLQQRLFIRKMQGEHFLDCFQFSLFLRTTEKLQLKKFLKNSGKFNRKNLR